MAIKIKSLDIIGLRGVKGKLNLALDGRSILLYGDNGTGKSSISDSLEWYYTDTVSHLSSAEIDLKEALRNSFLSPNQPASVTVSPNSPTLSCEKRISLNKQKLSVEYSNDSDVFKEYLEQSGKENLLLRYKALRDFVDNTKGKKLEYLSGIIGFSEVIKIKGVLKSACNSIKSEIKSQNFENQITIQKQTLLEKIGAQLSQERHLIEKINEIIIPLKTEIEVKTFADIDILLKHLQSSVNSNLALELKFLNSCSTALTSLKNEIEFIDGEYQKYHIEFELISNDIQGIMQTVLGELLKSGSYVLTNKYHQGESCPLCLQNKNVAELLAEINSRLRDIEESNKKKTAYTNAKTVITKITDERLKIIDILSADNLMQDISNGTINSAINKLRLKMIAYQNAANEIVTSGNKLEKAIDLSMKEDDFEVLKSISKRISDIQEISEQNNNTLIYSNIQSAKEAFLKMAKIELQKEILEKQKISLEIIYDEFVRKQKEGLDDFITSFSTPINEYYQFMNPGEPFQEIRIVTIGEEDELNGLTVEYKYNGSWASPPQKYFSESHINCFGLSFFLASVVAFNKINKFVVLDDVISSFDTNHRKRFADLIVEKFSDYQIILLTHEEEWFQYISQLVKRKNWIIQEVKWSDENGTYIEPKLTDLREIIKINLVAGNVALLGNPMRKYLEHILKEICLNLDVKVNFRYNDLNEKRMVDELLNELKSKINKNSSELKSKGLILDRLIASNILGNLLSHDNTFNPKSGDLKSFWEDVQELEKLFYCQDANCKKPITLKNYDIVAKKIRCGCGQTIYEWKN